MEEFVYVVAVMVSKSEGHQTTRSMTQSFQSGLSEAESVKHAIDYAMEQKPGFSVDMYLASKVRVSAKA